ncbi:molybdenum cofactor guanylyltransferase [Clostridium manihotivorum]|uniref:Probable molybdenum cofactor guanylyltransferase n=1 Tax=Clostridium manihotivorum TaxID=2320868 RepID=A0A3R5QZR9_9CLOT|nr:molybdenum cofactor guanylyltransferase [Clostridium manihotivorum]QAA33323.1 molybdenum cofactor guanylyltransferase [Clostridium manihotivorum]
MCYDKITKLDKFTTAVILAGGKSSRMGFDKQFLKLKEENLIELIAEKLKKSFEEIIIVTNKPELYKDTPYKLISDEYKERGPISGIYEGLKAAKSEYVYFVACDMPIVRNDFIEFMKEKLMETPKQCCLVKREKYFEPFNAFYSKSMLNKALELLQEDRRALKELILSSDSLYIEEETVISFDPDFDMFINLNTKEELEKYIRKFVREI